MAAGGDDLIEWHGHHFGRDGSDIVDDGEGADTVSVNTHASPGGELRLGFVDGEAVLLRINLDGSIVTMTDVETVLINAKGGNNQFVIDNIEDGGVNFVDLGGGDDELRNRGGTDAALYDNGDGDDVIVDFQKGFNQERFNGVTFNGLTFNNFGLDQRIDTVNGDSVTLFGLAGIEIVAADLVLN
jgi:hypothetical protein